MVGEGSGHGDEWRRWKGIRTVGQSVSIQINGGTGSARAVKSLRKAGTRAQRIILANAVTFRELCRFMKDIERTPTITELRLNYQFTRKAITKDQEWREHIEKTLDRVAQMMWGVDSYSRMTHDRVETGLGGIMAALEAHSEALATVMRYVGPIAPDEDEVSHSERVRQAEAGIFSAVEEEAERDRREEEERDRGVFFIDYWKVTQALGRGLTEDSEEFWSVVHELSREYPNFDWRNAITD